MPYTPYQDVALSTRYQIVGAPVGSTDGSGMVLWDVRSQSSANAGATWQEDAHWTVSTPGVDLETVLLMPDTSGAQKTAKNAAAKQLLVDNRQTVGVPLAGFTSAIINTRVNANGRAASAAAGLNLYVTVTLGLSYPIAFTL